MLKSVLCTAMAGLLLAASPASAITYNCELKARGNSGWIPEVVIIGYDENTGEARVLDPIIQFYYENPLPAQVATKNAKRITFKWQLEDLTTEGSRQFTSGFNYRLTIQNQALTATITGEPQGYRNNYRGTGTCKIEG